MPLRTMLTFSVLGFILVLICPHRSISGEISAPTAEFSLELLKEVVKDTSGNVAISPLSIYSLLSIFQQGSKFFANSELKRVLHASSDTTRNGLRNIIEQIKDSRYGSSLKLEHETLFKGTNLENVEKNFRQALLRDFNSTILYGNFNGSRFSNLSDYSKGILSKFHLENRPFSSHISMDIENYLRFVGMWAVPLSKTSLPFSPVPNEVQELEALTTPKICSLRESFFMGAKWIQVPLSNDWKVMLLVVLPRRSHELNDLIRDLRSDNIKQLMDLSKKDTKFVNVTLPRFIVNISTEFIAPLKKLGLRDIFTDTSDLSNIVKWENIHVTNAMQMGQLFLDEYGIRTTPLTAKHIYGKQQYFKVQRGKSETFAINEPFLFFIVDNVNSLPLFAGKVTHPQSQFH